MKEMYKKELEKHSVFNNELPTLISSFIKTIPNPTIPDRMKATIVLSELVSFAAQFRRNIYHWEGFELPINSTCFIIAGSGDGKDSAVKAVRRTLSPAYATLEEKREQIAKQSAIAQARSAGYDNPELFEVYKEFYQTPPPIYIAPTTPQGFIQHINDIAEFPIGSGLMFAGEIADEFSNNANFPDIIKIIAETYDTGDKEVVYTKGKDSRSKEISSMPQSALFIGSPNMILYDEAVKRKFVLAFGSKLARRSHFCYVHKLLPRPEYSSPQESRTAKHRQVSDAAVYRELISAEVAKLVEFHLANREPIAILPEVIDLFSDYDDYNYYVSEEIDNKYPLSKLVRRHLQWKALKVAGAFAIFRKQNHITAQDYADAIRLGEILNFDMTSFERELVKEPYELFSDYIRNLTVNGKAFISLHDLRKCKYIPTTGNPEVKVKDLIRLAASYDHLGIYKATEDGIQYESIVPTDVISISFKPIDTSALFKAIADKADKSIIDELKRKIATTANSDLQVSETDFASLAKMLSGNYAYSSFKFKDGIRNKEHLLPGTKWLVFDIDNSNITYTEAHLMLSDINHHVALSSDPANEFKFRVLLELDSVVDLSPAAWKNFYLAISHELALNVDPLPQSQIFFSYAGRPVLSVTDQHPLAVRDFVMEALDKPSTPTSEIKLTSPQKQALISDELETFHRAFQAENGQGSRELIKAAHFAKNKLDMPRQAIIDLIYRINDYWTSPMSAERLERTIISQIERFT